MLKIKYSVFSLLFGNALFSSGTELKTGRSRVRFPMVSLEFFIVIILPGALWPGINSVSKRNKYQDYFLGVKATGA
jgi:hypothetical protein